MINLRPAKSVQGAVTLPVSPDLLFMAALGACAAKRTITVGGVSETDVVKDILQTLSGFAEIGVDGGTMTVSPKNDDGDPAVLLTLPASLLPYRAIYLFMGLGMGKTVAVKSAPPKLLDHFIAQAKRVGITVETVSIGGAAGAEAAGYNDTYAVTTGLRSAYFDGDIAASATPSEDDCAALLAFLFGKREKLAFSIADYHLSTPLRQLAPAFGLVFNVRAADDSGGDPLLKRMRFLKGKQRGASEQHGLRFTIDVDFSEARNDGGIGGALNIVIPGDEILAAALITLKHLIPRGDLEISNAPLETWASQTAQFIKKMGGKINVKEGGKTAFGASGTVTAQKSECFGRKIKCAPIYQFAGQLPCMAVAAAFADGKSVFRELAPLRLSEPDDLDLLERALRPIGVRHGEMPDGIVVEGAKDFDGFDILEPLPAHVAAAFCVAGLKCAGKTSVADDHLFARCPNFEKIINDVCEFRGR